MKYSIIPCVDFSLAQSSMKQQFMIIVDIKYTNLFDITVAVFIKYYSYKIVVVEEASLDQCS